MRKTTATVTQVVSADWVEAEQLFGCLRQYSSDITCSGLVHQANGGVLIISLRTLLARPLHNGCDLKSSLAVFEAGWRLTRVASLPVIAINAAQTEGDSGWQRESLWLIFGNGTGARGTGYLQ